jgi:hypothetical protein
MTQNTRVNYILVAVVVTVLVVIFGIAYAFAQTVGVPVAPVELNPLGNLSLDALTWAATAAITVVTGFLSNWLRKMTIFQRNQSEGLSNERLSSIIYKGIDYAMVAAQNEVNKPGSGQTEVKFDNMFLSLVTGFVKTNAPELLNYFDLEPDQQKLSPRLNTMIMARLAPYIGSNMIGGAMPGVATANHFSLPVAGSPQAAQVTTASASGG